jgi:hypothetical protein
MEAPYWINGDFKWYVDKQYQDYLVREQAENLPSLTNLGIFRVINEVEGIDDYVLIDDNQQPIKSYKYGGDGAEQLEAFINILKISKHFDSNENNVGLKRRRVYEK